MRSGFMKPGDLAKKSRLTTLELRYLPFWVVPLTATSAYEGILERISPPTSRKGRIQNEYDWLVLGRKGAEFPTRDYKVPIEGKIPFDFTKIEPQAKFLNSELDSDEAVIRAKNGVIMLQHERACFPIFSDGIKRYESSFIRLRLRD